MSALKRSLVLSNLCLFIRHYWVILLFSIVNNCVHWWGLESVARIDVRCTFYLICGGFSRFLNCYQSKLSGWMGPWSLLKWINLSNTIGIWCIQAVWNTIVVSSGMYQKKKMTKTILGLIHHGSLSRHHHSCILINATAQCTYLRWWQFHQMCVYTPQSMLTPWEKVLHDQSL